MAALLLAPKPAQRIWTATRAQEAAPPGTPATLPRHVDRPGVHAIYLIGLLETVAAATGTLAKLTPAEFDAQILVEHEDADGSVKLLSGYGEVTGRSFYTTEIAVDEGMARVAWLIDGRLVVTDCTQIPLAEE